MAAGGKKRTTLICRALVSRDNKTICGKTDGFASLGRGFHQARTILVEYNKQNQCLIYGF